MGTGLDVERLRNRLDQLWDKVRRSEAAESSEESKEPTVRRCSYCREPGHYRPTCSQLAADQQELEDGYRTLAAELDRARAEAAQANADKQWWIDEAFRLQDEMLDLRRQLSSMAVYAGPTRGR